MHYNLAEMTSFKQALDHGAQLKDTAAWLAHQRQAHAQFQDQVNTDLMYKQQAQ